MKIGTIDLGQRPVLLAPMEDVTDIGFRLLCRRLGASMVYSEFVAADALVRYVNKSLEKPMKRKRKKREKTYRSTLSPLLSAYSLCFSM